MSEFELPSNIKQIGSIGNGPRIYVEDYVCTYLKQYAESGEHREKAAFLIGKYLVIDSQPVIFVNGAIQGKYCEYENSMQNFTQKSFMYAEQQMEKYFKGFEIVGWMQSQPGYSTFLNQNYTRYHMLHFRKPYQMLFIMDPVEKLNTFYAWNTEMTDLTEVKGYFVYYDKNLGMQEYMIDNKLISLEMKEKEIKTDNSLERPYTKKREIVNIDEQGREEYLRKKLQPVRRYDASESKRLVNMLVSLSAVLFIICFIMGAGLVQNDDRISQLESNLSTLNSAYTYISGQLKQNTAQPVFANQGEDQAKDEVNAEQNLAESQQQPEEIAISEPPESEAPEPATDSVQQPEPAPEADIATPEPAAVINIEPQDSAPDTYVVQQGDSLNKISKQFYGSTDMVEAIMEANGLSDPDKIFFGKILILPKQ